MGENSIKLDIPACFEIYNNYHAFGAGPSARLHYMARVYGAMGTEPACASLCEKCGKCEQRCPQHLPVQELLEDVAATFEGRKMKIMSWITRRFFGFQRWSSIRLAKKKANGSLSSTGPES